MECIIVVRVGVHQPVQAFEGIVLPFRSNGDKMGCLKRPFHHHHRNAKVQRDVGERPSTALGWML